MQSPLFPSKSHSVAVFIVKCGITGKKIGVIGVVHAYVDQKVRPLTSS